MLKFEGPTESENTPAYVHRCPLLIGRPSGLTALVPRPQSCSLPNFALKNLTQLFNFFWYGCSATHGHYIQPVPFFLEAFIVSHTCSILNLSQAGETTQSSVIGARLLKIASLAALTSTLTLKLPFEILEKDLHIPFTPIERKPMLFT